MKRTLLFLLVLSACGSNSKLAPVEEIIDTPLRTCKPNITKKEDNNLAYIKTCSVNDSNLIKRIHLMLEETRSNEVRQVIFERITEILQSPDLEERTRIDLAEIVLDKSPDYFMKRKALSALLQYLEESQIHGQEKHNLQNFLIKHTNNSLDKMRILKSFEMRPAPKRNIIIIDNIKNNRLSPHLKTIEPVKNEPTSYANKKERELIPAPRKKEPVMDFESFKRAKKNNQGQIQPVDLFEEFEDLE